MATPAVSDKEDEIVIDSKKLSSVRYVEVWPPLNRRGDYCYIYGEMSITDDRANAPVTIFSRDRHNPQRITLGDEDLSFLALSDHDSDRALTAFFCPIFVNLKLYEIDAESSSEEEEEEEEEKQKKEGVLIGNVVGYKIHDGLSDKGRVYQIPGKCGFHFQMSYATIYGARVEVELKINRPLPEDEGATTQNLFGYIEACENLQGGKDQTSIVLYENVDTRVVFGAPFPLARKFLVAPAGFSTAYLSIEFEFYDSHSNASFAYGCLSFPMRRGPEPYSFVTNKDRTHVKHIHENLVSVSIKFLDENMPGYWTP